MGAVIVRRACTFGIRIASPEPDDSRLIAPPPPGRERVVGAGASWFPQSAYSVDYRRFV
jgi:hypothetical protein